MRVLARRFESMVKSWDRLFLEAGDFASQLPPERLVSISHSAAETTGVVVVWYWGEPEHCPRCGYDLRGARSANCSECGARI